MSAWNTFSGLTMVTKGKYAHSLLGRQPDEWESLSDHLSAVAELAAEFGAVFGWAEPARAGGLLHDIGKCSEEFFDYIKRSSAGEEGLHGPDHSTAGARVGEKTYAFPYGRLLSHIIAGHHAGLSDWDKLERRLGADYRIPRYDGWQQTIPPLPASIVPTARFKERAEIGFTQAFLIRMLFSCLVDADFLATERFYAEAKHERIERGGHLDLATLRDRLRAYMARLAAEAVKKNPGKLNALRAEVLNHRLAHLLHQLQRMQFGRRSEKLDPDQLALAFEDVEQAVAATEADADKKDPAAAKARADKRRASRGALAAGLPRIHVTITPEDILCPCCRSPMHVIGEDAAERLDVIPAQFRVIVTHRPKYACRACEEAVVQAPAPERLIKGGLPTEAMVASVLVAKYAWHLPLYRQAQMLAVQGLDIKRAVLAFWVGYAAAELKPIYARLRELILASGKIAVDETVAPVLDPGRGRTKKGYFWAIARDDRTWGGTDPPAIAYSYAPGRGAVHGLKLLDGYRGIVQCDGYAAYKTIADKAPDEAITLAFCWAHLRRRF
ncbi:MAG: IS66 family transposase, partial [Xanthobacteraceae bacterium]